MPATLPPSIVAEAVLIMAGKFLLLLAPAFAVAALWWVVNRTDRIMHFFFPNLEWEHSLGWLNIRAERKARTALRWLGYAVYALLALALLGIVWSVKGLVDSSDWLDPWAIGLAMLQFGTIFMCLGAWVFYLGVWLMPHLRARREESSLKKYRVEAAALEAEKEHRRKLQGPSRVKSPLQKPRENGPFAKDDLNDIFAPNQRRRRL